MVYERIIFYANLADISKICRVFYEFVHKQIKIKCLSILDFDSDSIWHIMLEGQNRWICSAWI